MPATRLTLISLEAREVPAAGVWSTETFDQSNQIPSNWSNQGPAFQIVSQAGVTGNALSTNATSRDTSVLWQNQAYSADTSARVQLLATTLVPMQLIVRGQNLGTNQASYYGVQITRGLQIELFKMVNGTRTTLASLTSKSYTSGIWIEVTLNPRGANLGVQIKRLDNNQFLDATGTWQSYETTALTGVDSSISNGGRVGLIRAARYAGRVDLDNFSTFEPIANLPSPTPPPSGVPQTFDAVPLNSIPSYWSSWGSDGTSGFGAAPARVGTSTQVLNSTGSSARTARVWDASAPFTDATATATILLDSLIPMQVFVRGSNLNSATPSYYAVEVTRGLNIALVKVQNGQTQVLETFSTSSYVSGIWADVSLTAQGTNLQVRIRRNDTGQWLSRDGTWLNSPTSLMDLRDTSLQGAGFAGLARVARYSGTVSIDRMTIRDASWDDLTPPNVNLSLSPNSLPLSGIVTFAAQVSDPSGIDRVEFLVDGELVFRDREAPYQFSFDTRNLTNGRHTFTVRVWDRLANMGET
ncbi:MAG: Ig-like domain-containing protein, partial [Gemmataceae bacterium]|nr:Ig-like domain-containing protein [Gemmataceae bacterium]